MTLNNFLSLLLALGLGLYAIRGLLNWVVLSKTENSNHPRIFSRNPNGLLLMIRHLTISSTKFWWQGDELRTLKTLSNIISGLLYFLILVLALVFIISYKL